MNDILQYTTKNFQPIDSHELKNAVYTWRENEEEAMIKYGNISNWDVSKITDMSYMFFNATNFNSDISNWDVSNVTNMKWMFYEATNFNSDISNWDTSNVTQMRRMFFNASNFNSDISNWDTSKVTDMSFMFEKCPIIELYKPKNNS